jgi:hypothetical protein
VSSSSLLSSSDIAEEDAWASYLSIYKYPEALSNATQFVIKTIPNITNIYYPSCRFTPTILDRLIANCSTNDVVPILAERQDILWMYSLPTIKIFSSISNKTTFLTATQAYSAVAKLLLPLDPTTGKSPIGDGTGRRGMSTDTSIDPFHCAFYDPKGTVPYGYIQPGMHSKILGYLTEEGVSDGSATTGSHGEETNSLAWGNPCLSDQSGVAPVATFVFYSLAPRGTDNGLVLPNNLYDTWQTAHVSYGVTVHFGSWGTQGGAGQYDDICNIVDTSSYNNPELSHFFAGGNTPDEPPTTPGGAKNVGSVGASRMNISQQTSFTSSGYLNDGRRAPLFLAPGWYISAAYGFANADPNHADYTTCTGSSCATPEVAAMGLALGQRYNTLYGGNPRSALVFATLMAHAIPPTAIVDDSGNELKGKNITTYGTPILDNANRLVDVNAIVLQEAQNVQTVEAVCFHFAAARPTTTFTLVVKWIDLGAQPGSSVTLINDLDVVVITPGKVWWSEDGVSTHEYINTIQDSFTYMRVLVFPYENTTTDGPVTASLHANFFRNETTMFTGEGCDTCFPGDTISCGATGQNAEQYCLVNGSFSNCYASTLYPFPYEITENTTSCDAIHASQAWDINGTTCVVESCESGYVLQDNECVCVQETFLNDCVESNRIFRACLSTGDYETCSEASQTKSSIKQPPAITSSTALTAAAHTLIVFYLTILFFIA